MAFEQPADLSMSDVATHKLADLRSEVAQQSLVDAPMAWDIAKAQKPYMDELVESRRSISQDHIFRLATLAERASQKVEWAYRDGVEYVPDTPSTNAASPAKSIELAPPTHPVVERLNNNLTELEYRAVTILNGLRVPATSEFIKSHRVLFADSQDVYARFESVNLYDPASGSLINIELITQENPGKNDLTIQWNISDTYVPMDDAVPGKRLVGRGLSYYRDLREKNSMHLRDAQGMDIHSELHDDDPLLIENWFTRLAGGIPVTEDEINQLFVKHRKSFEADGLYRGKTIHRTSDRLENTDSRAGRRLLQALYDRRVAINGSV